MGADDTPDVPSREVARTSWMRVLEMLVLNKLNVLLSVECVRLDTGMVASRAMDRH